MTAGGAYSDLAARVASSIRLAAPWEVLAEHATRYEVHLQGRRVEVERGPITVDGYGVRVLRPRSGKLGTGFVASTDLSPAGIADAAHTAEATTQHTEFPAKSVELPSTGGSAPGMPIVDPRLWSEPARTVRDYAETVLRAFDGRRGVAPSFGSVKVLLSEVSLTNSAGLNVSYPSTLAELELAVKADGEGEGRPPGEFWVTSATRRLDGERTAREVDDWCRYASDVRRAVAPPSGEQAVILPTDVLQGIVPPVVGFRFTGAARLRKIAPEIGAIVGARNLTIRDEGDYPWSVGSSPYDDEGRGRGRQSLIEAGAVKGLLYDTLYGAAFSTPSTGNALRGDPGPNSRLRFTGAPGPGPSTLVIDAGDGGSLEELAEQAGDGILVTQLGWARPDAISAVFGGEIRIGYRIRGGKIAEPVRGGTVGGTVLAPKGMPSVLADVEGIGSQTQMVEELVSPPLLVRTLTVAGS